MDQRKISRAFRTAGVFAAGLLCLATPAKSQDPIGTAAAGVVAGLATVISVPVKIATCTSVLALASTGYGLTIGNSEFVRDELVAGTPRACGGEGFATPQEIFEDATGS